MQRVAQYSKQYIPEFSVPFRAENKVVYGTKDDVYDELFMTGILFEFDGEYTFWLGIDIGNIIPIIRDILYTKVKEAHPNLKKDHFMVNGTHTHEGPEFYKNPIMMGNKLNHIVTEDDLEIDFVIHMAEIAKTIWSECKKNLAPFHAEISVAEIEGCYSNRNGLNEPADKNITLIRFLNKQDDLIALWLNMTTHSTLLHPRNQKMSGDLVGQVCEKVSMHYGLRPMPTVGCAGDSSTRLVRHRTEDFHDDVVELQRISNEIVRQIIKKENFKPIRIDRMEVKEVELIYHYTINPKRTDKKMEELLKKAEDEKNPDRRRLFLSSRRVLEARIGVENISEDLKALAINMGELKWGAYPGELVGSLGLKVIRHQSHDHRLVACYINDKHGYLIEKEKYDKKGFESLAAIIPAGLNEVLNDMVIKELDTFDEG